MTLFLVGLISFPILFFLFVLVFGKKKKSFAEEILEKQQRCDALSFRYLIHRIEKMPDEGSNTKYLKNLLEFSKAQANRRVNNNEPDAYFDW